MAKHFEELWEESEGLFKDDHSTVKELVAELKAKLLMYEAMNDSETLPEEEKQKLKSHVFGKILATLTHLSLTDNVNTFKALSAAVTDIRIEQLESKYH